MLKFFLILFLISYIIYRLGGAFFKFMSLGNTQSANQRRAQEGRADVQRNAGKDNKGYKGGEYIDFEEVKD